MLASLALVPLANKPCLLGLYAPVHYDIIDSVKIFHYEEISSSQALARELLAEENLPFVVSAKSQSSGKGTKGRSWHSPQGGLYFTLALELDFNLLKNDIQAFSEEACLLVVSVLRSFLLDYFPEENLEALSIKPINDLYFEDAKLAGVLLESVNDAPKSILLIGIGLNVQALKEIELDRKIISLEELISKESFLNFNKDDFLDKLVNKLSDSVSLMQKTYV